jgi:hypothetical protein
MQKLITQASKTDSLGSEMGKTTSLFRDLSGLFDVIYATGKQYWDERDALPVYVLPDGAMKELLEILGESPFNSNKTIKEFIRENNSDDVDLTRQEVDAVYRAAKSFYPPILQKE